MIIVMEELAAAHQVRQVVAWLNHVGLGVHHRNGCGRTVLAAVGASPHLDLRPLASMPGVRELQHVASPYELASRSFREEGTQVALGNGAVIGGEAVLVMAGPCAVESRPQIMGIARQVATAGAAVLRGGAFKPRTSPYSFQGLGEDGLHLLREAADAHRLLVVSEIMDPAQLSLMLPYVDILQVGARNMQNFNLLRALGAVRKPVLLKRGISASIEEWLLAAEYIMLGGNYDVILCERGIRTFETATRNTLDLSAIPTVKRLSHLPVVVDPSHAVGTRDKVPAMARAAIAAGADGLLIEVHDCPEQALSDGAQALYPQQFAELMREVRGIAAVVGRNLTAAPEAQHAQA